MEDLLLGSRWGLLAHMDRLLLVHTPITTGGGAHLVRAPPGELIIRCSDLTLHIAPEPPTNTGGIPDSK